jgi:hypothetical protein
MLDFFSGALKLRFNLIEVYRLHPFRDVGKDKMKDGIQIDP